jgi:hypothetical protein
LRTVASIGIVGGAALATIGVVLFVRSPKSEPTALLIGPGSFALARRF